MLKQRVLTSLLLLPLVIAAIFVLQANWFLLLITIILLGAVWEYRRLAGFSGHIAAYSMLLLQALVIGILVRYRGYLNANIVMYLSLSCGAWLVMFVRLSFFRPDSHPDNTYRAVSFITAIVSVTTGWFAISWIRLQPEGSWLILLLLLIVWAADTGAYFAGKTLGKRKLSPQISPGKTLAGLFGGLIAACLVALLAATLMPLGSIEPARIIPLGLVVALVSVGGDLLISLHKRTTGLKDSGNLLPGHGGILDRLDSLLAAAPFYALGLLLSGF